MLLLPLIAYFAIENLFVWKVLQYDQKSTRKRVQEVEREEIQHKYYAYALFGGTYIRDFILAEFVRGCRADLIYSPATQKILTYLSIASLVVAITARFWSLKSAPLLEFFYPIYKNAYKDIEPTWNRSFFHPVFFGSWALYLTAFLWQPSISAVYPLVFYPLFLQASFYFQENCEEICKRLKETQSHKGIRKERKLV